MRKLTSLLQGRTVFQVMFSHAPVVILHPKYLNEVKSHPDLDFRQANQKVFISIQPLKTSVNLARLSFRDIQGLMRLAAPTGTVLP